MNTAPDISLIVDEPIAGHFYWILQQRDRGDGNPHAVGAAPGPMPSYGSALMAGMSALQRITRAQPQGAANAHARHSVRSERASLAPPTFH